MLATYVRPHFLSLVWFLAAVKAITVTKVTVVITLVLPCYRKQIPKQWMISEHASNNSSVGSSRVFDSTKTVDISKQAFNSYLHSWWSFNNNTTLDGIGTKTILGHQEPVISAVALSSSPALSVCTWEGPTVTCGWSWVPPPLPVFLQR